MSKTLYLECASGISGDMFVAALLDLGADQKKLKETLASIQADGAEIVISRVKKSGLDVCDFLVKLDKEHENHDHDMSYLHGHEHGNHEHGREHEHCYGHEHGDREHDNHEHNHCHAHNHDHEHNHEHCHDHQHDHQHDHNHDHDHQHDHVHSHDHNHDHDHQHDHAHSHDHNHDHDHQHAHSHNHVHRGLPEMLKLLRESSMTERAYTYAEKIFCILAEAESKAHGVPVDQVHFHEVGAIDSILDIAAAAICLDDLDVSRVYVPELTEGSGTVRCQHGILPIPVPAVSNIAAAHELPICKSQVKGELITPTGAAIAAAIRTKDPMPARYIIEEIGLGAGKREYETPGFLRAMLIRVISEQNHKKAEDKICKLETDVDDCTGEMLGHVMKLLFEADAKDVHYTPIYMKKNRPAVEITVICEPDKTDVMESILFRETTTIGIRRCLMERTVLERSFEECDTPWGKIRMKVCRIPGCGELRRYPEYEDARAVSEKAGIPLVDLYRFFGE